jgi:isoleucyl-tRNA synthetase
VLEPVSMVAGELVDYKVKPNYRALGPRFGGGTRTVAAAVAAAPAAKLAGELQATGSTSVTIPGAVGTTSAVAPPGTAEVSAGPAPTTSVVPQPGEEVTLSSDELIVTQVPRAGWPSARDGDELVALDVNITPELRREGLAREVIRLVQDARKADGLEVSDRIALHWEAADPELAAALTEHGQLIAGEVLATEFGPLGTAGVGPAAAPDAGTEHRAADLGLAFWIRRS